MSAAPDPGATGATTHAVNDATERQLASAHAKFDEATDFTLGVEEEFAILDPGTLDLVPRYDVFAEASEQAGLTRELAGELLASEVEFRTGVCATWGDARDELTTIRRKVNEIARSIGARVAASATHPWADYREQQTVDLPYYNALVERMQWSARRNNTFGLHVHVGVRGADRAIRIADALRTLQPHLLALSASSPFLDGVDTGLASARHWIFSRNFIRGNVAPVFGTLDSYCTHLRWLLETGSITGVNQVWWGTRPHILHGTVELRMFDGQPDVRDTLALVAMAQGVVALLAERHDAGELPEPVPAELIEENAWRAARWGTEAMLIELPGTGTRRAGDTLEQLIGDAEAAAGRAGLDAGAGFARARELVRAGSSAAWQRSMFTEGASLAETYGAVVDATMSSATAETTV